MRSRPSNMGREELVPAKIGHIRLAHDRGYGPIDLSAIEIISGEPYGTGGCRGVFLEQKVSERK